MAKISGFIIAKNESMRIAKAINSIKNIVEEIIVIDSGSIDNTVQIARNLGAKVIFNEWSGYIAQKSFGENLCENDWIININGDEELSVELQNEIEFIFSSDIQDNYFAYQIKFLIVHRNDLEPRFLAPCTKAIRLYNRKFGSFANSIKNTTHDSVVFNSKINIQNKIYNLNGIAYHRFGISIE